MTFRTLIRRSLRFHWRSHLGVVMGAVVGSAALIGALVVGDSVKGSLRERALERVGNTVAALHARDRTVGASLAGIEPTPDSLTVPALLLRGSASSVTANARANHIQVVGVDHLFWQLGSTQPAFHQIASNHVVLNRALATSLGATNLNDEILIRLAKPGALSLESALAPKDASQTALRLKVQAIMPGSMMGQFSLHQNAEPVRNAFLDLNFLAGRVDAKGRANVLVIAPALDGADDFSNLVAAANTELSRHFSLADAQTFWRETATRTTLELRTPRVFLDAPVERAALAADTNAQPILTYIANLITSGTNATPYSMVTAAGAPWTPTDLQDDEIVLNQWIANDLEAEPGDTVSLVYYDPESGARLVERSNTFRVHSVVPMAMPWADRTLMPEFPGIKKAERARDWDTAFPLKYTIRDKDDAYWREHRGTPKAFVTLAAGQKMWGNRFGNVTAIRFPIPTNSIGAADGPEASESFRSTLERKILANLNPAELGLRFEPVREQALKAADESQDFGGLFIGFSMFIIVAALILVALLFQFGLEQRAAEVGTLLALGFTHRQVLRLFLGEGTVLAFIGGVVGVVAGVFYAKAMLLGLTTVWRDAIGGAALKFFVTPMSLLIGLLASAYIAVFTLWLALRKQARRPAVELLISPVSSRHSAFDWEGEPDQRTRSRIQRFIRKSTSGAVIGVGSLIAAASSIGWAIAADEATNAEVFFSAGSLVLIGGVALISAVLKRSAGVAPARVSQFSSPLDSRDGGTTFTTTSLALRGLARRRFRSVATAAMLASGAFLILSIGVFRLDANRDATERTSGTGGFALIGESTVPVAQDLNSPSGRDFFALDENDLRGVDIVPFRVHQGDEASCLNLNRAQQPRLLGVKPEAMQGRFTFTQVAEGLKPSEGWLLLESAIGNRQSAIEIPAIGDAASIQWAMGKKVGDTIDYVDGRGRPFKVRIVGAVANSILQGSLIIDEAEFTKRFPDASGYQYFLMDAPSNRLATVSATLSRALQDYGLEVTSTTWRLNQFNAVQNTYLGTFQVLGGLGLLLGSVGLGIVVLRNVLERRGELAVLLAVGFRRRAVHWVVLVEHATLLGLGLAIGLIAAAVAVLPSLLSPGSELSCFTLALTLAAVLANGVAWAWVATRVALRGNLLEALRNE